MRSLLALTLVLAACGDDAPGNTVYFELDGSIAEPATFWDLPFPSDLRLGASGAPDMTGSRTAQRPDPQRAADHGRRPPGLARDARRVRPVHRAGARARDHRRDPRGRSERRVARHRSGLARARHAVPDVAVTLLPDPYVTSDVVALAPRPGIVLRASTRYAYVIRSAFAPGFSPAPAFAALAAGKTPSGSRGAAAALLHAPLWPALEAAGIDKADALVAVVFTTSDEVARTHARSEAIRAAYEPTIDDLVLVGGATFDGFCQLRARSRCRSSSWGCRRSIPRAGSISMATTSRGCSACRPSR